MLEETVHQTDVTHAITGSGEVAPQPTPRPDKKLLDSYSEWLFHERRLLCMEMYPDAKNPEEFVPVNTGARAFHFSRNWAAEPQPSTRSAATGSTVGGGSRRRSCPIPSYRSSRRSGNRMRP